MRRYGVDSALLAYAGLNRRVSWWDPGAWALVYRAHDARVFVRRAPRFTALIAAHEIPATFGFTLAEGAETIPLRERPAASPVPDCEWQRRLGELYFELEGARSASARAADERALEAPGCLAPADERHLAAWMGALALGDGRTEAALARLARALALGDGEVATRVNRAVALERLGRAAEAAAAWDDVAARATDDALVAKARARAAAARR
jgi:predicted Zn-dependent protease